MLFNFFRLAPLLLATVVAVMVAKPKEDPQMKTLTHKVLSRNEFGIISQEVSDEKSSAQQERHFDGFKNGKQPGAKGNPIKITQKDIDGIAKDFDNNKNNEETGKAIKHRYHKVAHLLPVDEDKQRWRHREEKVWADVAPPKRDPRQMSLKIRNAINDNRHDKKNMKKPKEH